MSMERRGILYVVWPFHLLVALAWWLQDRWAQHVHAPSWIEREVDRRVQEHLKGRHRW